jgi:hypothetical protein
MLPMAGFASAVRDESDRCERAALRASREVGVPIAVLRTIALAESGRTQDGGFRPWPWTANFGGDGQWFETSHDAQLAVAERQATGATNIDIGCFQINLRWHGDAFPDLATMFDPDTNALHAARFLARLHDETGSWPDAAAAYHSRTPEHAQRYRARFETLYADLTGALPGMEEAFLRVNGFPLLQAGDAGAMGSLVPKQAGGPSLFGGGS